MFFNNKSAFFSIIDLANGFHQISVREKDSEITVFSTGQNHYQSNKMPFGLKIDPATFQQMINTTLSDLINQTCFVYLE